MVRLLLSFLCLPYQRVPIRYSEWRERSLPELLEVSPSGEVPVLKDGELILQNAEAILVYLAARYDSSGVWFPRDPVVQGRTVMWLAFAFRELLRFEEDVESHGQSTSAQHTFKRSCDPFEILDEHLAECAFDGQLWLAARHATIADIACFSGAALASSRRLARPEHHQLNRWLRRCQRMPGFVAAPRASSYF